MVCVPEQGLGFVSLLMLKNKQQTFLGLLMKPHSVSEPSCKIVVIGERLKGFTKSIWWQGVRRKWKGKIEGCHWEKVGVSAGGKGSLK